MVPLGIKEVISCHRGWKGEGDSGIYLWIKKDSWEKTLEVLNIRLQ